MTNEWPSPKTRASFGLGWGKWLVRVLAVWLLVIAAETLNGTLREFVIVPLIGSVRSRQISFLAALVLILALTTATVKWIGFADRRRLLATGAIWSLLTLGFELVLIGTTSVDPHEALVRDYDIRVGGLMPFGLVWMFLAPWLACRIRTLLGRPTQ